MNVNRGDGFIRHFSHTYRISQIRSITRRNLDKGYELRITFIDGAHDGYKFADKQLCNEAIDKLYEQTQVALIAEDPI